MSQDEGVQALFERLALGITPVFAKVVDPVSVGVLNGQTKSARWYSHSFKPTVTKMIVSFQTVVFPVPFSESRDPR